MKTSQKRETSPNLPRYIQLTRDNWCEAVWSEVTNGILDLPNITIDFGQFPTIKVKSSHGEEYVVKYKQNNHRYLRVPLNAQAKQVSSYLVVACCGEKCYFDLCRC